MIITSLTSLILVIAWIPVIDFVTDGKYGGVNRNTIFILSLCISFLYFNNFLWTIYFSCSRLKEIFRIFVVTFTVNAIGDVVLIPLFHNEGAAMASLLSLVMQSVLFKKCKNQRIGQAARLPACLSGLRPGKRLRFCIFFTSFTAVVISAVCIYLAGLLLSLGVMVPQYKVLKNLKKD